MKLNDIKTVFIVDQLNQQGVIKDLNEESRKIFSRLLKTFPIIMAGNSLTDYQSNY